MLALPKVVIVLGARQVGKTTLVRQVVKDNVLFLNLDIEVDKQKLLAAASLAPQGARKSLGNPEVLIIDEAQRLPEASRIVKGWFDSEIPTKFILLGSSSLNLLNQSAESLTGRNLKLFLPPLLFTEILASQSWYSPQFSWTQVEEEFKQPLRTVLLENMVFGSYPEAITTGRKKEYLTNLVSDYLLKDVLQLGLIKTPEVLHKLLALLAHQVGSEVSVNELANSLNISRITVERYLDLLEETFVIFKLPAFSTNPRKEITKSTKIYFWDTGIRNTLINELNTNPLRTDIGQLWENWVIAEVGKRNLLTGGLKNLYFWRSRSGSEVDLVVKDSSGTLSAYEIKWQPNKPRRAFTDQYKIGVEVIDSTHPILEI